MSKKILIITYYWPPGGGVGVQRWMNYAIQLKNSGWEPIIYTPGNPQFEIKDVSLLERVKDIPVIKQPIWEPFDLFHKLTGNKERQHVRQGLVMEKTKQTFKDKLFIWIRGNMLLPDPRVFWLKKSVDYLEGYLKVEGIGTIITTGPPHSMHLIGRSLKKKTGVGWLADFRDPWSKWDVLQKLYTSTFARSIHRRLERSVLQQADVVTTVSTRLAASLSESGNREVEVLHNGVTFPYSEEKESDFFTIGYYGMLNELRNPDLLWKLLNRMCGENTAFADRLNVRIGGIVADSIRDRVQQMEHLSKRVEFLGYLEHERIFEEYKKCNVLLLLQNKSDNAGWILPVKFFEYLAARRIILGLGKPEGDLGNLFRGRNIGDLMNYEDIEGIRHFISEAFDGRKKPDVEDVNHLLRSFAHETLFKKLEDILRTYIIGKRRR